MTALKRLTVSYNELTRLDDVSHMVRLRSNQSEFLYQFCCGLAKFFDPKKKTKLQNYSSKESDMYLISPYSITLKSNIDAMRIKEMTSNSRSSFSWLLDKFSLRYHRKCIENGIESLHADIRILMVFLKFFFVVYYELYNVSTPPTLFWINVSTEQLRTYPSPNPTTLNPNLLPVDCCGARGPFPVFFMAFLCVVVIVEVLEIIPCSCFADIFGVSWRQF